MTSVRPVLSVCIATMNRTRSIDAQIASLLAQIETLPVEIVVIDATDAGKATTASWRSHPSVNYRLLARPNGVDQDYDLAVRASVGDYCWLLPDDDRLRDGALERLFRRLIDEPDLVLVNAAVFDANLDAQLRDGLLRVPMPSRLEPPVTAQALAPANLLLTFIGSIVIRRSVWMERMEERFLGSEFAHVGVILSKPLERHVVVDHEPYLDIRYGAGHWESRWTRVWGLQWPALVDSVVSDPETRAAYYAASDRERVRSIGEMRAYGLLGPIELAELLGRRPLRSKAATGAARLLAALPARFANRALGAVVAVHGGDTRQIRYDLRRARTRLRLKPGVKFHLPNSSIPQLLQEPTS